MTMDVKQEERKKVFKDLVGPELPLFMEEYATKLRKNKRQNSILSKRTLDLPNNDASNIIREQEINIEIDFNSLVNFENN